MGIKGAPCFEVGDIFKRAFSRFCRSHGCSKEQFKAANAIMACRTSKLGGHKLKCKKCGYERIEYNSCRNRHCPKCQGSRRWKWALDRIRDILPIPYYHAVFTLPHSLNVIALFNKRLIYNLFFEITSEALKVFSRDKRYLGAQPGFVGLLHTWGQNLSYHIHIHYIVTGGGITSDKGMWKSLPYRKEFLFPVKAMSRYIRKRFTERLLQYYNEGKLLIPDDMEELSIPFEFKKFIGKVAAEKWVCYVKKPFSSPELVLKYVSRYSHRVAIANSRILNIDNKKVTFNYKEYKDGIVTPKVMWLSDEEFIRRFLNHVLPSGFRKIRHFGIFSNGLRNEMLALARELLKVKVEESASNEMGNEWERSCPQCGQGVLTLIEIINNIKLEPG